MTRNIGTLSTLPGGKSALISGDMSVCWTRTRIDQPLSISLDVRLFCDGTLEVENGLVGAD